jgi:hypothetical protein
MQAFLIISAFVFISLIWFNVYLAKIGSDQNKKRNKVKGR